MTEIPVNQSRLISLFGQLVSLDSPSYGERAVGDFLAEKLASLGAPPQEDDAASRIGGNCGNLHALLDGEEPLPPLLFCAHMDTVEPSCGKKMLLSEDGTITSDGTTVLGADDAAAIAAILEALTLLRENDLPHRPIELLFTAAEEPYCVGIQAFDFSKLASKEAYVFDLTGEMGAAAIQAPTILSFTVTFSGRAAHAGFAPESGIHAVRAAACAITQIPSGRVADSTVNVGTISGGTANNIVPDSCCFTGEIRSYTDSHAVDLLHQIKQIAQNAAEQFGASVDVQGNRHVTAYQVASDAPVVARYRHACEQLGLNPTLCSTFGGSDNNHLVLHGIQGIVPATAMFQCHTCHEYTTISDLTTAAKLAYSLMTSKE
ncbi:MAG: M20/M25/M40 family metallo-hydrolase [Eubacteriales bacterium]|nr:M20/M25/M40 family metallo-hydrolase [Eubacteriales bacterium]